MEENRIPEGAIVAEIYSSGILGLRMNVLLQCWMSNVVVEAGNRYGSP